MKASTSTSSSGQLEFVARMATLMSLAALSTDIMLPGLLDIGREFQVRRDNDLQLIVSVVFFGIAPGQLMFGLLADSMGRKQAMLAGVAVFLLGSVITVVATSLEWMLIGRVIQGVGLGAPRVVTMAIVRDQCAGAQMAKVMSNIMSVFACIPMVAPLLGQAILSMAGWRAIFAFMIVYGGIAAAWFHLRQIETLRPEHRVPLELAKVGRSVVAVCREPLILMYSFAAGFIFAGFVAYMSAAAQIFQQQYATGAAFGVIFGLIGFSMAVAAHINSRWVVRLGVQTVCVRSLGVVIVLSSVLAAWMWLTGAKPGLLLASIYFALIMSAEGGLYSNLNSLAMEPLSKGAGLGASIVSLISMIISVPLGIAAGRLLTTSILPLVLAFAVFALLTLIIVIVAERLKARTSAAAAARPSAA